MIETSKPQVKTVRIKDANGNINKYDILYHQLLGDGSFGNVYNAFSYKTKEVVAVKVLLKDKLKLIDTLKKEVSYLKNLVHPNIVKFIKFGKDTRKYYIFTEKCDTDMLESLLLSDEGKFDEDKTRFLMKQIGEGIRYMHKKNIAHCDIKPENILFDIDIRDNPLPQVKICDFGYARKISPLDRRKSYKGTVQYSAPEILANKYHGREIDVWSFGAVMYISLTGKFPFLGSDSTSLKADIVKKMKNPDLLYAEDRFKNVSKSAVDLLKKCLKVKGRGNINEILSDAWFENETLKNNLVTLEKRLSGGA